jgi:hypothetical protein
MNKPLMRFLLGTSCLARLGDAFVGRSFHSGRSLASRHWQSFSSPLPKLLAQQPHSYDVDEDEDAEQRLGENPVILETTTIAEPVESRVSGGNAGRYDDLIASVGLEGKLKHAGGLPAERTISSFDVFCNRELKHDNVPAIGFDMDYTLVQYKQPAFDKLAFDGAKEKLVKKLGYPEDVLDFEYDHEVRLFVGNTK